ncbi:RNA recognition motif-containing protein, partial [Tulasnella sp. 403]
MPSNKGKEKEAQDAMGDTKVSVATHKTTIFVNSLPYSTTSTGLLQAFSDIAPVRRAFIVTHKDSQTGEGLSKGIGYVTFALKEDAEALMRKYHEHGMGHSSPSKPPPKPNPKPKRKSDIPKDEALDRTVVLTGLPSDTTNKLIWKKVRKYPGSDSVSYPVEGNSGAARVIFDARQAAEDARTRLDGSTFHGAHLKASIALEAFTPKDHSGRLIIRNLPKNITENELRSLFSPYGSIHSITIPSQTESSDRKRKSRFAFVWMYQKAHAQKALDAINGSKVSSGVHGSAKSTANGAIKDEDGDVDMEDSKEGERGRVVAVDFALPKASWEAAKQDGPAVDEEEEASGSDGDEEEVPEDDIKREKRNDPGSSSSLGDEDSNADDQDIDGPELGEGHHEQKRPEPPDGTVLFVRNVPFEASEEDLSDAFRSFGPIRYARITVDHETGHSRGTGFVCFWKREAADKALEEAERVKLETNTTPEAKKGKAGQSHSLLMVDPSSSFASKLVLMGRTLDVCRALPREEAAKLKAEADKVKQRQKDGRNLYLLREGVVFEDSAAAQGMPSAALTARVAAFEQRRSLLRSNPALYVSQTRLSVRHLPRFVTDRSLKRLALHAIKSFDQEVKEGKLEDISKEEREVDMEIRREREASTSTMKKKKKSGKNVVVKQSKIGRDRTKVDPLDPHGLGRSEGYGFLGMGSHVDALKILRWVNNRHGVAELLRGWWKEELEGYISKAQVSTPKGPTIKEEEEEAKPSAPIKQESKKSREEAKLQLDLWQRALKDMKDESTFTGKNKPLLVEFSIENRVVTRRREAKLHKPTQTKAPAKPDVLGVKRRRKEEAEGEGTETPKMKRL